MGCITYLINMESKYGFGILKYIQRGDKAIYG